MKIPNKWAIERRISLPGTVEPAKSDLRCEANYATDESASALGLSRSSSYKSRVLAKLIEKSTTSLSFYFGTIRRKKEVQYKYV